MAGKVPFCAFWNPFTAPSYENILGQRRVWIIDLDKGELDSTVGKLINQIYQFTLCSLLAKV